MKLTCPECGAHIPADNINVERLVAKCGACDAVFAFGGQLGAASSAGNVPRSPVERVRCGKYIHSIGALCSVPIIVVQYAAQDVSPLNRTITCRAF